jgi:hypothetical protein
MKFRFKADYGLVYVRVKVSCADREVILNLALDTGASGSIVSAKKLIEVGYDLDKPEDETYITTGSGLIFVPKFTVENLTALGKEKTNFQIIAHDFPPTSSVDGMLGLDFLRGNVLTVDFVKGEVELK